MKSCIEEGAEVYLSPANNPNRRTPYTWEMIKINGSWVGINTFNPNKLAVEIIQNGTFAPLAGYTTVKPETKYGDSRFDVYAGNSHERCFVEVKNVSMKVGDFARFPDAITQRGQKHLNTLMQAKLDGYRVVMLYIIQRIDVNAFGPAWDIDQAYAETLVKAVEHGVEIIPLQVQVSPEQIVPLRIIPLFLNK